MNQILVLVLGLLAGASQRPITTPRELLEAMHARYDGKWYRTLTFVQNNTEHHADGSVERSVWREWLQAPRVFDLAVLSEGTWQGRPVWIVGAKAGDLRTRQFWVDKERLVFVRLLEPTPGDTTKIADTRFNKYQPLAGGWVSPEVEFLVNGQQTFLEEYTQLQANVAMPAALWDARQWKAVRTRD